jgi:uncharacterized protein
MVTPGGPAVCFGTVVHHRRTPVDHHFTYPVTQIWLDPDDPDDLCRHHPLWRVDRPAPVQFRRRDYLDGTAQPLGTVVRRELAAALGVAPDGPLRMLTQPRTWGWLFNPITIYLAWSGSDPNPVAAVLEVTNTPWKERHLYPVALTPGPEPAPGDPGRFVASFDKALHVSPFLGQAYRYQLRIGSSALADAIGSIGTTGGSNAQPAGRRLTIELDVIAPQRIQRGLGDELVDMPLDNEVVLATRLSLDQLPAERALLTQALRHYPLPTHRVSLGIHHQAFRLWRKGVPIVAHPKLRSRPSTSTGAR